MTKQAMIVGLSALLACGSARAGRTEPPARIEVMVHVENPVAVPSLVLSVAKLTASRILSSAGVRLRWSTDFRRNARRPEAAGCDATERLITLRFASEAPAHLIPTALAVAHPFVRNGVQIAIFHQRLPAFTLTSANARVLAHVLVHEIVHVLQSLAEHTESDLMRAMWTPDDFHRMAVRPFDLSAEDIERIHRAASARVCAPAPVAIAHRGDNNGK